MEREQELKERRQLNINEWSCVDMLLGRMKNLTQLSVRITASLTRSGSSADLEPEPETEEGEEVTPDPDSLTAEINLTSGTAKWTIRPEWVLRCIVWGWYSCRVSFSEELAGLHKTMTKLLKQKETLQRELGNKYGACVVSFPRGSLP